MTYQHLEAFVTGIKKSDQKKSTCFYFLIFLLPLVFQGTLELMIFRKVTELFWLWNEAGLDYKHFSQANVRDKYLQLQITKQV